MTPTLIVRCMPSTSCRLEDSVLRARLWSSAVARSPGLYDGPTADNHNHFPSSVSELITGIHEGIKEHVSTYILTLGVRMAPEELIVVQNFFEVLRAKVRDPPRADGLSWGCSYPGS